jgi:hypothetical protein
MKTIPLSLPGDFFILVPPLIIQGFASFWTVDLIREQYGNKKT